MTPPSCVGQHPSWYGLLFWTLSSSLKKVLSQHKCVAWFNCSPEQHLSSNFIILSTTDKRLSSCFYLTWTSNIEENWKYSIFFIFIWICKHHDNFDLKCINLHNIFCIILWWINMLLSVNFVYSFVMLSVNVETQFILNCIDLEWMKLRTFMRISVRFKISSFI